MTEQVKRIRLLNLVLRNFKGIREFSLEANGENIKIYGDNAVGKTSLFDAFNWLLFDKDSQNKKDFQIKTLDTTGNVIHGLNHEVEATLLIDDGTITLQKVYSEKWTKKRGSATTEFTGHTTDYFIDGVPSKKNEFTDMVDEIVKEDIFKLITSPTYFNEQLHWQERRKILLAVCGGISDQEVIDSSTALAKLPGILNGRSLEDHRKIIVARRSEINKDLDKIPVRIDEVLRTKPDITGLDEADLQRQIKEIQVRIDSKDAETFRVRSGGEISVKEKRLREIEGELLQIKNNLQAGTLEKVTVKRQEIADHRGQLTDIKVKIGDKQRLIDRNTNLIDEQNAEAEILRKQWFYVDAETYEQHHDANCPTCGQALPEDQVQSAHQKALAEFNRSKADRLEQISTKGKKAASEAKRLEQENVELSSDIESLNQQLNAKENEVRATEEELKGLQTWITDVETDTVYAAKKQEEASIVGEINQLRTSATESLEIIRNEIADMKKQIESLEQEKLKFGQVKNVDARADELKQQERALASEYERLEQELFLSEEFIRVKVNMLESRINSKFKYARFKLFEQQINGGLSEVCETTYQGVPYSSGLNNAARINVGLDIINTLSEHYGFSAPIFIDNAEAVTKLIDTTSQVICLIVPPSFDKLPQEAREKLITHYGGNNEAQEAWAKQNKHLRVERV